MSRLPKPDPDPWSPRLPDLEDRSDLVLDDGLSLRTVRVCREDWTGCQAAHVDMDGVHLGKIRMTQAVLGSFRAADTLIEECDMSAVDLTESSLYRVEFRGCKMTGFIAAAARFERTRFIDCRLDLSSFRSLEAEDCEFRSCDLRSADFEMAALSRVSFVRCRLSEASFRQARLQDVDLRSSDVTGLRYVLGLKGATIEPVQLFEVADALAREIGIRVSDE